LRNLFGHGASVFENLAQIGAVLFHEILIGPSNELMFSALKLLVSPSTPVATFSSFIMMALRSGCSTVSSEPPGASLGASGLPFSTETKFLPHQSGELMTALLSVLISYYPGFHGDFGAAGDQFDPLDPPISTPPFLPGRLSSTPGQF